ncbi:MAG TPA: F0F1 ATP synthase subunit A [Polyangiaceae bacterium]|nr:F0F1 ATP synthase subunit A [Polyangiaceae bacterium]
MGHSNWLTFLLAHMQDTLQQNASALGDSFVGKHPPSWHSFEPIITALLVSILLLVVAFSVRARMSNVEESVVPDDRLTLRTFMEIFLGYFYDLAKSVMDADRAKKYFPVIATSACFVFFSNVMALFPGFPVATSHLSITLGCALVVFILFNIYGLATNGLGYIKHLAGPAWYLAPLVFFIELISLCVRPVTLAVRLLLNMAVDHLILGIFLGLVAVLVPIPVMLLGCIVVVVQTLVFSLLTCVYIGLATEHEEH